MRRNRRALGFAAIFLGALLAGCVGSDPSPHTTAPVATFDASTGAIRGTVTDDELRPLQGAQVALLDVPTPPAALTDDVGIFTLSNVPPGEHRLAAAHLGYDSVVVRVHVEAGQATQRDIVLSALAVQQPWVQVLHHTGFMEAGIGFVRAATCLTCGDNATSWFFFGGFPDDFQGVTVEATWRTPDYLGVDLNTRGDASQMWYRVRQPSPVHFFAERCGDYTGPPTYGRSPMPCTEDEVAATQGTGEPHARVETWYVGQYQEEAHTFDPVCQTPLVLPGYEAGCYGVGLALDLRWETWVSLFRVELPPDPESWSALPDA